MDLDKELDKIQEGAEIGIVLGLAALASLASLLVTFFTYVSMSSEAKSMSVDKTLSNQINEILGSSKWRVHVLDDGKQSQPNAFSLGFGKDIFITSSLVKMLTTREIIAVLLHEVYHSQAKHTVKGTFVKFPFVYLMYVAIIASVSASVFLAVGLFLLLNSIPEMMLNIFVSKKMEMNSDKFAIKYGYGKDLISALDKIENYIKTISKSKPECTGVMCKFVSKINNILSSHPEYNKRVENILEEIGKVKSFSISKVKNIIMKLKPNQKE